MWTWKPRCRSMVTPRSFRPSTCSIFEFPRWRFNEPSTILFVRCFPITKRHFVSAAFVTILLAADHCERLSRSCWRANEIPRGSFVTSDEKLREESWISTVERWAAKGGSLMNRGNMMGPSMFPCGTPAVTVLEEEQHPTMTMYCLRPLR